jgi:hypothetical protein
MRKRTLFVMAVLALLLLSVASVVGAQDEEAYLLPILVDGETVEGEFLTASDAQLYAFQGTEGDVVNITLENADRDSIVDPYLVLLGEAGQVYAANDTSESDKDSIFAAAIENFELPATGSYFIVVTTFFGTLGTDMSDIEMDPSGYILTAEGYNLPDGADPDSFLYSGSSVPIGSELRLYSNSSEPIYFVDFVGAEGDVVDIVTTTDTVSDTVLWLFAPNGIRIAAGDDNNGLAAELLGVELPEDGKYFVFATGFGFINAADGNYTQDGEFDIAISLGSGGSK